MRRRIFRWVWPLLAVASIAALAVGLQRGDYDAVNRWAHALCTSCIGLGEM